jgi:hypothetical protein
MPGMRTLIATLFLLSVSVVQLKANTTVKQYKADLASGSTAASFTKVYVYGLGEGFLFANIKATEKKTPLYCQPDKLALSMENYVDIVDRQIKERSNRMTQAQLDEIPIAVLLFEGLQETFPCTGK